MWTRLTEADFLAICQTVVHKVVNLSHSPLTPNYETRLFPIDLFTCGMFQKIVF